MKTGRHIYKIELDQFRGPIYSLASSFENALISTKKQLQTEESNRQKIKIPHADFGPTPEIKSIELVTNCHSVAEGD